MMERSSCVGVVLLHQQVRDHLKLDQDSHLHVRA
jgi:hypothetical protein